MSLLAGRVSPDRSSRAGRVHRRVQGVGLHPDNLENLAFAADEFAAIGVDISRTFSNSSRHKAARTRLHKTAGVKRVAKSCETFVPLSFRETTSGMKSQVPPARERLRQREVVYLFMVQVSLSFLLVPAEFPH